MEEGIRPSGHPLSRNGLVCWRTRTIAWAVECSVSTIWRHPCPVTVTVSPSTSMVPAFNAPRILECRPRRYGYADSVQICLSKGLGAPVAPSWPARRIISRRKVRKMLEVA